jgi:hypothetical protein
VLPRHAHEALVLDQGAVALVCTPDTPKVCVRRVHRAALDGLREPAREALAILSAKLPQAPTRVVEAYFPLDPASGSPLPPRPDTLYAEVSTDNMGRIAVPARDTLWALLMGAGTQPCDNAPPFPSQERTRSDAARLVAAAWLLDEKPLSPSDRPDVWGWLPDQTLSRPAYEALRALPADEQRARVAALREAELACGGRDRLAIGMSGLIALGTATLGAGRAWVAPVTWAGLAWALDLPPGSENELYVRILVWMFQPADSTPAAITAAALGMTGMLAYGFLGPHQSGSPPGASDP